MDIQTIISRLKQYPFFDVEKGGVVVRKQVATDYINAELIADFIRQYGEMYFIPKRMKGNSPYQLIEQRIKIDAQGASAPAQQFLQFDTPQPVAGLGNPYTNTMHSNYPQTYQQQHLPAPSHGGGGDMYKIFYETTLAELRETKNKLEEERERRHKAELELSGSKNSVTGDIMQGLAGIAPVLLQNMGAGGALAGTHVQAPAQTSAPRMQPVTDKRVSLIVRHYSTLDEQSKQGIYEILDALFADLSLIGSVKQSLSGIDGEEYTEE